MCVRSNSDQLRAGAVARFGGREAVEAFHSYLSNRKHPKTASTPLFALENGTPLSHADLIKATTLLALKANVPMIDRQTGRRYEGVNFRKGGATALAESGVPDRVIQELGRWKSFAYQRYIHSSEPALNAIFTKL